MTKTHRSILATYSLLWVAACCGLIILAWNETQQLDVSFGSFTGQALINSDGATRWAFTLLMAALALPGILTFSYALTWVAPMRPGFLKTIHSGEEGETGAAEVARMIEAELDSYPDVKRVSVGLTMKRGSVDSQVQMLIDADTEYGRMEAIGRDMTEYILHEQLGTTPLRPVVVTITLDVPPPPPAPVQQQLLISENEGPDVPRVPDIDWDNDGGQRRRAQVFAPQPGTRPVRRFEAGYHDD